VGSCSARWSVVPVVGVGPTSDVDVTTVTMTDAECALCAVGETSAGHPEPEAPSTVVAYLDDELIALLEPGLLGVLLAPRSHVQGLATQPGLSAVFLAALRRAVTEVQSSYGTSGAMVKPTTDVPGASGHVCYHVVPTMRDEMRPPPSLDLQEEARYLANALGDRAVPRQGRLVTRSWRPPSPFAEPVDGR
jgi:hypothetical protein